MNECVAVAASALPAFREAKAVLYTVVFRGAQKHMKMSPGVTQWFGVDLAEA